MCAISDQFTIMTKTKGDSIGKQYTIDKNGNISNEKPTNTISTSGTVIILEKPFYDLPVRRQIAIKQASNNMKKIQDLLVKYALVYPNIRFSSQLMENTKKLWIKPATSSIESSIALLFDASFVDMLEHCLQASPDHPNLAVDVFLPKANSDPSAMLKGPDRVFIYVNDRPINYVKSELKDLVTLIRTRYRDTIGLTENTSKKTPFIYLNIRISPDEYDVNIEPNKTTILFHNKTLIYDLIESKVLNEVYPLEIPNDIVTPPIPTTIAALTTTPITQENDWSFNMDSTEFDELASDSSDIEEIMHVRSPPDDSQVNKTPILTSHLTPVALNSAPSVNKKNAGATLEQQFIPKKRTIHAVEEDEDEGEGSFAHLSISTPTATPPTQRRIYVPRVSPTTPRASPAVKPSPLVKELVNTLNETMTVDCSIEEIKANYPRRKEILTETYRISIDEYLSMNNAKRTQGNSSTSIHHFPKGSLHDHISLYTRGSSMLGRHRVYQVGAVNLKSISVEATVQKLTKELKLICKKPLERPVQIQMDHSDHLCPVLISLKSKEQFVNDDFHGQDKITYSEITDETIINNGFKVRWRKDLYSGNLVVQFTSIYSLGSGYGPSDFRELLTRMLEQRHFRPKKVMAHIQSLAHQLHHGESSNGNINYLEEALDTLDWKKQDSWDLGYGSSNKVLACLLLPPDNN
ncbi:unnamed protein product [Mucor hiemalis]